METENMNQPSLTATEMPNMSNGSSGTLPADDWKAIIPADIRGAEEFKEISGFDGLARQFLANKRAMGGDFEPATEDQAVEYFKRAGAPDTVDEYDRLSDIPDDDEGIRVLEKTLMSGAFAAHLTKKQYAQMRDSLFDQWKADYEKQAAEEQSRVEAAAKELRDEFGTTLESRLSDFRYLMETAGLSEWARERKADADPVFIKAMLAFGEKYVEPSGAPIGPKHTGAANIESEIRGLMASPAYMDGRHPQHADIVSQVYNMRRKLNGEI